LIPLGLENEFRVALKTSLAQPLTDGQSTAFFGLWELVAGMDFPFEAIAQARFLFSHEKLPYVHGRAHRFHWN